MGRRKGGRWRQSGAGRALTENRFGNTSMPLRLGKDLHPNPSVQAPAAEQLVPIRRLGAGLHSSPTLWSPALLLFWSFFFLTLKGSDTLQLSPHRLGLGKPELGRNQETQTSASNSALRTSASWAGPCRGSETWAPGDRAVNCPSVPLCCCVPPFLPSWAFH